MSRGQLSPMMLNFTSGFLQNKGIVINQDFVEAVERYKSSGAAKVYSAILTTASELITARIDNSGTAMFITPETMNMLRFNGGNFFPLINNSIPLELYEKIGGPAIPPDSNFGLVDLILYQGRRNLGLGDYTKFVQIFGLVQAFVTTNNQFIESVNNVETVEQVFNGTTSLSTGGVDDTFPGMPPGQDETPLGLRIDEPEITINTLIDIDLESSKITGHMENFELALGKLGQLWDMQNLKLLGFPSTMLYQMNTVSGILPEFSSLLTDQGIDMNALRLRLFSKEPMPLSDEFKIYQAMTKIQGSALNQTKFLLDVKIDSVDTMADLLDPKKILPTVYSQLQIRVPVDSDKISNLLPVEQTKLIKIYRGKAVNSAELLPLFTDDALYRSLSKILPPDIALANRALSESLLQIKNIFSPKLPDFAKSLGTVETNKDLPEIQNQKTALFPEVADIIETGSNDQGTFSYFDLMGTSAGFPYAHLFDAASIISERLAKTTYLRPLINKNNGIFTVMQNAINGDYVVLEEVTDEAEGTLGTYYIEKIVIPEGLPGAGEYESLNVALSTALIPIAEEAIGNIPKTATQDLKDFTDIETQIITHVLDELTNLENAGVDYEILGGGPRTSLLSFCSMLHNYGNDTGPGGAAIFLKRVASTDIYGEALLSSLREGRNIASLNNAGIAVDTQL